jgi:hypothetical protein
VPTKIYRLGDVVLFKKFNVKMVYIIRSSGDKHYFVNVALNRPIQQEERLFVVEGSVPGLRGQFKFSKEMLKLLPHRVIGDLTIKIEDRG